MTMDAVGLFFLSLTPATYFAMLAAERVWPARSFPERSRPMNGYVNALLQLR